MNPPEYDRMFRVEDHHWWYQGMAEIIRHILRRRYKPQAQLQILDAGCGTGAVMASLLTEYGRVTGCDISPIALQYCRRRRLHRLLRASVARLPFTDSSFDLVTSFDVLYGRWLPDERDALREMCRVLRPGGRLILRLPAWQWMYRKHDRAVNTRHRYTREEVEAALRQAGFRIELCSYANFFLFPFAVLQKLFEILIPSPSDGSDLASDPGLYHPVARCILTAESIFIPRGIFPIGLSVIAVGRKSG
jgi:ubiquinone/menaquinone biosynthesis C-methylase UbiE